MDTFDFKRVEEELQEQIKPGGIGLPGLQKQQGWSSASFGIDASCHVSTIILLFILPQTPFVDFQMIAMRNSYPSSQKAECSVAYTPH